MDEGADAMTMGKMSLGSIERLIGHRVVGQMSLNARSAGTNNMVGKKHASEEITAKMAEANRLAAQGKTQREISKALGVSTMTYHRWKKLVSDGNVILNSAEAAVDPDFHIDHSADPEQTVARLRLENQQLRRLVTNVLLEKLKLEDELRAREQQMPRPGRGK